MCKIKHKINRENKFYKQNMKRAVELQNNFDFRIF